MQVSGEETKLLWQLFWPNNSSLSALLSLVAIKEIWWSQRLTLTPLSSTAGDGGLSSEVEKATSFGFRQDQNGPCCIAALHAHMLANLLHQPEQQEEQPSYLAAARVALSKALATVLWRTKQASSFPFCRVVVRLHHHAPEERAAQEGRHEELWEERCESYEQLLRMMVEEEQGERFQQDEGGLVRFLYSLALSKGLDRLHQELLNSPLALDTTSKNRDAEEEEGMMEETLVTGPWGFASQALMNLLLVGQAIPHLHRSFSSPQHHLLIPNVGFLTLEDDAMMGAEDEKGGNLVPSLGELLKRPQWPVWVLHGGDHYTLLYALDEHAAALLDHENNTEGEAIVTMYHYNGLPPAGPRLACLLVSLSASSSERVASTTEHGKKVAMIVRRRPIAAAVPPTASNNMCLWEYEVALDRNEKVGTQLRKEEEEKADEWRCRDCVLRGEFFVNSGKENAQLCKICHKARKECGECLWLRYEDLPLAAQKEADLHYLPKIENVLRLLWPLATVSYRLCGDKPPSL